MMWVFIVSDAFIFGAFLAGYAAARLAATDPWPAAAQIFALHVGGISVPLLLIAIMTFILISSSGTMAIGVAYAYRGDRTKAALFVVLTTLLGLTFLGMQVYEWTLLIAKGFTPWGNPEGAAQFGASFFMLTGFHGLHVTAGVIYLTIVARRIMSGVYDRRGSYEGVELCGLYWHFVDLVWVFIFAFFYLI
jgi:cytochrome c oxidase subunit 3